MPQVHFIVNNLSTANLEAKGNSLKDLLPREFWPWFSNYMVVKRAAQVGAGLNFPNKIRSTFSHNDECDKSMAAGQAGR